MNNYKILSHCLREADIEAIITNKQIGAGPLLSVISELNNIKFDEIRYNFLYSKKEIQDIYAKTLNKVHYRCENSYFIKLNEGFLAFINKYLNLIQEFYKENINCKLTMVLWENKDGLPITHIDDFNLIRSLSKSERFEDKDGNQITKPEDYHLISCKKPNEVYVIHDLNGVITSDFTIYQTPDNSNLKIIINRNDFPEGMPDNFDYSKDIYGTLSNIVQKSIKELTLIKEINEIPKTFDDLITNDPEMIHLISFADFIAKYNNNVLLLGKTGTGKELFARAIHESSKRTGEFIPVNCGAIPKDLFEAELFGIKDKTATFVKERIGKFEAADKGTIFLDEIGEIPLEIQSKLLRVIETKEVTPIGSNKPIKVDFRLICATNKPLLEVLDKEFRGDLYYRIDEINISLPFLRQRVTSDVEKLLDYFLKEIKKIYIGFENITITESVLNKLRNYEWPGNVREIKRFVQKAFFIAAYMSKDIDDEILNRCLDLNIIEKEIGSGIIEKNIEEEYQKLFLVEFFEGFELDELFKSIKKEYLKKALALKRNQTEAGKLLGYSQPTINKWINEFKLSEDNH